MPVMGQLQKVKQNFSDRFLMQPSKVLARFIDYEILEAANYYFLREIFNR